MEEKIPQLTLTPELTQTPELTEKPVAELQTAPLNDQPDTRPEAGPELAQLSPEEQAAVAAFAEKIDITDTNLVLQYGAAAQKNIADFSANCPGKCPDKGHGRGRGYGQRAGRGA